MTTLSNIFLEIDLKFTEEDKAYGEQYLVELIEKQSRILFRQQDIKVEVHLEDGSLKVFIRVVGYLYIAIGLYGSFRSGIDYSIKDTQTLYQVIRRDLEKNGLSKSLIKQEKVNSGVINKIKRLIVRLEKLEKSVRNNENVNLEIKNIRKYTERILWEIDSEEDRSLVMQELIKIDRNTIVYEEREPNPLPKFNPANIFIRNKEENDKYLGELEYMHMRLSDESDETNKLKNIALKSKMLTIKAT